jgi:hypothetical protein
MCIADILNFNEVKVQVVKNARKSGLSPFTFAEVGW